MNLKKNQSKKLIKFDNFPTKMLKLKIKIPFFMKKKLPQKFISRHTMQPSTLTRREYKGKIYVKNSKKKFM